MATLQSLNLMDAVRGVKGRSGWEELEFDALVIDVTGTGTEKIANAVAVSGLPAAGSPHPVPAFSGLLLDKMRPIALPEAGAFRITLEYRAPQSSQTGGAGGTKIRFGTSYTEKQVDTDYAGNPMIVSYTSSGKTVPKGLTTSVPFVINTVQFTRRETKTASQVWALKKAYVHMKNSAEWQGEAIGKWLCYDISADSDDGGVTFLVTYTFWLAGEAHGWDYRGTWLRDDGSMPTDLVEGTGRKWFTLRGEAAFGSISPALPSLTS